MDEWARIVRLAETDATAAEQLLERLTGQGAEDGGLPATDVRARHVA